MRVIQRLEGKGGVGKVGVGGFFLAVADAAVRGGIVFAFLIEIELTTDEVTTRLEHDFLVLRLRIEHQGRESDRGVVSGARFDADAAVRLGVAHEEGGGLLDLRRDGITGLAVRVQHEAGDGESGLRDGFGLAPLTRLRVLGLSQEVQAALGSETEFLSERFVTRSDGRLRKSRAGGQKEGEKRLHHAIGQGNALRVNAQAVRASARDHS